MIEIGVMTGREISPHSACTTRNKRMTHARHFACIVTRQSASVLFIWLKDGRSCVNCTGPHKAENCHSKMACQKCNKKHHTSICDSDQGFQRSEGVLATHQRDKMEVVYPVVLVKINGIKARALLDTGAGSLYASAQLVNALHIKPAEIQTKLIEMILGSMTTKVEMYDINVTPISGDFSMCVTVSKVDKT